MKTKQSQYHLGVAPTSRAKCRRCRRAVPKGAVRLVVTAFVTRSATARFSRCLACLDAPLAAAVKAACGGTDRLLATPGVDPAAAEAIRAELHAISTSEAPQKGHGITTEERAGVQPARNGEPETV